MPFGVLVNHLFNLGKTPRFLGFCRKVYEWCTRHVLGVYFAYTLVWAKESQFGQLMRYSRQLVVDFFICVHLRHLWLKKIEPQIAQIFADEFPVTLVSGF
jgi:hypothetical protein